MTLLPLSGVTVLEHARFIAGPMCGRMLAELGAEVIKIEPPEGDRARAHGPFLHDDPDPETSAVHLYVNANKRSITLDPATPSGAALFLRLLARVDVLIEDAGGGRSPGLDEGALLEANPRLVHLSLTPFGRDGPYASYAAYDLQTFFAAGEGYALPGSLSQQLFPGRQPARAGAYLAESDTGACAAVAVLSALIARNLTGQGQRIDLSRQEAAMAVARETLQRYAGYGETIDRRRTYFFGGIFPAKDGYVSIFPREDRHWQAFCEVMQRPDLAADPRFKEFDGRSAHKELLNGEIRKWASTRLKREVYQAVSSAGCPCGYFATAEDLLASQQLAFRRFFQELPHPRAGRLEHPTFPHRFSRTPGRLAKAAPLLGQDNQEVYCRRLGLSPTELADLRRAGVV